MSTTARVIKALAYFLIGGLLITSTIFYIDSAKKDRGLIDFQMDIQNSLQAYSTIYKQDTSNMHSISLGYVSGDDKLLTGVKTNSVSIDTILADSLFKKMLKNTNGFTDLELTKSKYYITHINTIFDNGVVRYNLKMYSENGILVLNVDNEPSMDELQRYIQNFLGVSLDISYNYDASIKKAQAYRKDKSSTLGTYKQDVNSTYDTYMAIFLDVPLKGFWEVQYDGVRELQTYSILRSDY